MIRIKFFAYLRESLGVGDLVLEGADGKTIVEIKKELVNKGPAWHVLSEDDVLCAINQSIVAHDSVVNDGDELAFFPPVTGG